jgi:hypothetical protein
MGTSCKKRVDGYASLEANATRYPLGWSKIVPFWNRLKDTSKAAENRHKKTAAARVGLGSTRKNSRVESDGP